MITKAKCPKCAERGSETYLISEGLIDPEYRMLYCPLKKCKFKKIKDKRLEVDNLIHKYTEQDI